MIFDLLEDITGNISKCMKIISIIGNYNIIKTIEISMHSYLTFYHDCMGTCIELRSNLTNELLPQSTVEDIQQLI